MAGGVWTVQNKVLPGVYTNFIGVGPKPSLIADQVPVLGVLELLGE